jgi:hypothetical protein
MPAIDPDRLARQIENLRTHSGDPDQIARAVLTILEEYSEPARPSTTSVPAPVIRSLRTALRQQGDPKAIAEALWKKGIPDSRLLAAGLIGDIEDPEAAAIAEGWAGHSVPIEIVRELGERGLAGWRRADPTGFVNQISEWLDKGKRRGQVLAVYALRGRVGDDDFEDLPSVFELLEGRLESPRGEMREGFVLLIAALMEVAFEETANFLDDEKSSPLTKTLRARLKSQRVGVV